MTICRIAASLLPVLIAGGACAAEPPSGLTFDTGVRRARRGAVEHAVARGFTLIEALITVAILGILAAIAAPSLYLGVVRNQIVESAPILDLAKRQVAAVWSGAGAMPATNAAAGLPPPAKMVGNYVKSVTVRDGVIDVVFGNNASNMLLDKVLTFRPAVVEDAPAVPVAWVCARAPVPANMTVYGEDRTDIPSSVRPVNCR
jgi:type IV pilus assembly protein PilA